MATALKSPVAIPRVPPLYNGDCLSRAEFERRFNATPGLKKAELIEGVVYMSPAVFLSDHGRPHFRIIGWLSQYCTATPGVDAGDNFSLRLDMDNEPQPDAALLLPPEAGGGTRVAADKYVEGAPELVVEVAASSVSYDLHAKLNVYRRNGVREYIVWRVFDEQIDWYVLRDGSFSPMPLAADGFYHSEIFPGLWLDATAMVGGDYAKVSQVLQQALATPEHEAFVAHLQKCRQPKQP